jgi:hypothetical protein
MHAPDWISVLQRTSLNYETSEPLLPNPPHHVQPVETTPVVKISRNIPTLRPHV